MNIEKSAGTTYVAVKDVNLSEFCKRIWIAVHSSHVYFLTDDKHLPLHLCYVWYSHSTRR